MKRTSPKTTRHKQQFRSQIALMCAVYAFAVMGMFGLGFYLLSAAKADPTIIQVVLGLFAVVLGGLALLWVRFDEKLAKPYEQFVRQASALAHANDAACVFSNPSGQIAPAYEALQSLHQALTETRANEQKIVGEATARADRIKARLELVIRDLQQGVIICTREHDVLLYNPFAAEALQGAGQFGLGRSVFECLAAEPLRHAFARLESRYITGRYKEHENGLSLPLALTSQDGVLTLEAVMSLTLVKEGDAATGYMLTISDRSKTLAESAEMERQLVGLSERVREEAASVQLLSEALSDPDLDETRRKTFRQHLLMEAQKLSETAFRLDTLAQDKLARSWPMSLVLSTSLYHAVVSRTRLDASRFALQEQDAFWLKCDSAAVGTLLARLMEWISYRVTGHIYIVPHVDGGQGFVDLRWHGEPLALNEINSWMRTALDHDLGPVTALDVLARHGSDIWSASLNDGWAYCRLPLDTRVISAQVPKLNTPERPQFYDFDLFDRRPLASFGETPLRALDYVVFDTETTGLEPSKGDKMVQLAGVRIVNGQVLYGEIFDSYINPERSIPEASTKVHGISQEMVKHAPNDIVAASNFHAFAKNSVLVAHNAPFDMAFLNAPSVRTSVEFNNTVLDTVLLAAHLNGAAENLTLDRLTQIYGVTLPPDKRHTALGDAIATAEVLLAQIDHLASVGVVTLNQALAVSEAQVKIRQQQNKYS